MWNAFLVIMNTASMNLALPPMMTAFGLNLDQVQWVVTAYMIAAAVLVPTIGWLGNLLGNRNLLMLGLIVFIASSILCGLAWSGSALIGFRILQGIGAGPIAPMAMVFLNQAFPPQQRGLAMGLYGLGVSCGPVLGPVLGGYITEHLSWRMVFYVNVIPGLIGLFLVLLVIPNTHDSARRPLDLPGLVTMTLFLVSLLIALTQGRRLGWDSPFIQRLLIVAGITFLMFVAIELLRQDPLVDLRLYKNGPFTAASIFLLITAMSFWGTSFLQTFLLQDLLDYTPAQAGFVILPGALTMAATTLLAGRLVDKIDRRIVIWGGLAAFAYASYLFSFLTLDQPVSWMVWMIVGRYVTIGFIFTPMNAVSMMVLPPDKVRMGSGLVNLVQQGLGGTIGLAIMTTYLQSRTAYHATVLGQEQTSSSLPWEDILAPVHGLLAQAGDVGTMVQVKAMAMVQRHLMEQATIAAYQDAFVLVVILCITVAPLVWFLRPRRNP